MPANPQTKRAQRLYLNSLLDDPTRGADLRKTAREAVPGDPGRFVKTQLTKAQVAHLEKLVNLGPAIIFSFQNVLVAVQTLIHRGTQTRP